MPQLHVTKSTWEKEYSTGTWDYLDTSPVERARSAIIGMYCQRLSPHGKILDVGCGLGTTVDFLNTSQKKKYVGLDISKEALRKAAKKKVHFQNCDFAQFQSKAKFDIILFNEVLYYMEEVAALRHAARILSKSGKIIVSLYRMKNKRYDQKIWKASKKLYHIIETVEIMGMVRRQPVIWKIAVLEKMES